MSFMDELKRLTQPYDDDDDDFYEDAANSLVSGEQKSSPKTDYTKSAKEHFEESFANVNEPAEQPRKKTAKQSQKATGTSGAGGSIFGNLGDQKKTVQQENYRPSSKPAKKKNSPFDAQVVLFNPKDFDEAGELVTYISQGRSLVMALEGIPIDTARRLLDFISGICFAMNAKITPVSAKTYFVTPENVDILDAQALQKNSQAEQDDF